MRLLYGRHPLHTFGKTQNTPVLSELYPENEIWINGAIAEEQGIANGQLTGMPIRIAYFHLALLSIRHGERPVDRKPKHAPVGNA